MKKTFTLAITLLVVGLTVVEAQTTTGWPPANILREYGIEGMPQPTGATNVRWRRAEANEGSYMLNNVRSLYIPFSGTNATLTALRNWFDRNGWTLEDSANGVYQYTKGNAGAYFDCSGGTGQIQAGIISPQTPTPQSGNARALIGEWSGGSMDGTLEFFSSNEWHFDYIINGTYSYTGSTLTLTSGGKQGTAQVTVSGNTLTIGRFSGTLTTEGINDVLPGTYKKR